MTGLPTQDWQAEVRDAMLGGDFRRATFGGVLRGADSRWNRIVVRPVEIQGGRQLQFSYFDERKDVTKNALGAEVRRRIDEIFRIGFSAIHVETTGQTLDVRITKKGKAIVGWGKVKDSA
ncbi:MAG: hypothetical protein U0939_27285 [Pirellulales bacterium]